MISPSCCRVSTLLGEEGSSEAGDGLRAGDPIGCNLAFQPQSPPGVPSAGPASGGILNDSVSSHTPTTWKVLSSTSRPLM